MRKPVVMCVCYRILFAEVKQLAEINSWSSIEQITQGAGCGSGCGACRPYLVQMLETGEVEFDIIGGRMGDR